MRRLLLASLISVTACTSNGGDPEITIPFADVWIAPVAHEVTVTWNTAPTNCQTLPDFDTGGTHEVCDSSPIDFTIASVSCDNCALAVDHIVPGTAVFSGHATAAGPIHLAITVDHAGDQRTVDFDLEGDVVTGLAADCWTSTSFDDARLLYRVEPCGATKPADMVAMFVLPTVTTANHGSFQPTLFGPSYEQLGMATMIQTSPLSSAWNFESEPLVGLLMEIPASATGSATLSWGDVTASVALPR